MGEPAGSAGGGGAGLNIRTILLIAGVILVVAVAGLVLLFRGCAPRIGGGGSGSNYTVIYSNLDLKDAANVIARLKELNIKYELRDGGQAIAVEKEKADVARLGLAEKNLPLGGVVGWEIFDESRLGATDFDRRIQLIRAISGELSRTIKQIHAVEDARVQIVLPETKLFAETTAPVTASVMLRLKPGTQLTRGEINGIIHLVASSVENLQTENVTVIDNTGRILTVGGKISIPRPMLTKAAEAMTKPVVKEEIIEIEVEKTAPQSKEAVAATEKLAASPEVVVQPPRQLTPEEKIMLLVQAKKELELDLSGKAQEILNRFYPPNSAIIKVNLDIENGNSKYFSRGELKIKKISAIILVDNRVELTQDLKQSTYKAVAAAIGYNRNRGDKIVMQRVPFHLATPPPDVIKSEVEKVLPEKKSTLQLPVLPANWIKYLLWLVGGGAGLILVIFIFSKLKKKPSMEHHDTGRGMPPVESAQRPINQEKMSTLNSIKSSVDKNPEKIAQMLKKWLTE